MIYPHPESLKRSRNGRVSTSTWPHVPLPRERVRAAASADHSPTLRDAIRARLLAAELDIHARRGERPELVVSCHDAQHQFVVR
ncbi:hypothetical protein BH09PSE3_BH09PSE3_22340 [soil metagenome]